MDLGEIEWGDVDWIGLAKDRNGWRAHVNAVMNLQVLYNIIYNVVKLPRGCMQMDVPPSLPSCVTTPC
jgi:hypothetical protein